MVLVAGCVDAIGFMSTNIFPANMTGNAVLIAVSFANPSHLLNAADPSFALASFCCGCFLGAALIRKLQIRLLQRINLVILCAGFAILGCAFTLPHQSGPLPIRHLLAISFAMGLQSAAALEMNVSGAGITTVITNTLTNAISKSIAFLSALLSGQNPSASSSPQFPILVFVTYFCGAFFGVFNCHLLTSTVIIFPGLLLVGVAFFSELFLKESCQQG